MYGHIHIILKDLVDSVAGAAAWHEILVESGYEAAEGSVLDPAPMGDDVTLRLVAATCKVLDLPMEKALYVFGRHFIQFALRSGSRAFLRSQGATFPEFLDNINSLHNYLERAHPSAKFPFLVTEVDGEASVTLSYSSTRQGLKFILVGAVEEIGLRLFGVDVVLAESAEVPEELKDAVKANRAASWKVTWTKRPNGPEPLPAGPAVGAVSFPTLHSSMAEFAALLRKTSAALPPPCGYPCGRRVGKVVARRARPSGPRSSQQKWEAVRRSKGPRETADLLLRTVPAVEVAAAWSDPSLAKVSAFWHSSKGRAEDYDLSRDDTEIDVFISHSWGAPPDWEQVMGADVSYADVKSTMVSLMAKDIAVDGGDINRWVDVRMWVDKACIVQDIPELKEMCINLIDKFIHHSEHVCVVFTWSYLERLWCVYEWAAILVDKDPRKVWMQNELLVTERTLPLYLSNVRLFSLARTKCFLESDRAILHAKIQESYVSEEAFQTLVKATAIALMARSMAFRAGRSKVMRERFFVPWVSLAEELGFHELAEALATCRALEWREDHMTEEEAALVEQRSASTNKERQVASASDRSVGVSATRYHALINNWFDLTVVPVVAKIRQVADLNLAQPYTSFDGESLRRWNPLRVQL